MKYVPKPAAAKSASTMLRPRAPPPRARGRSRARRAPRRRPPAPARRRRSADGRRRRSHADDHRQRRRRSPRSARRRSSSRPPARGRSSPGRSRRPARPRRPAAIARPSRQRLARRDRDGEDHRRARRPRRAAARRTATRRLARPARKSAIPQQHAAPSARPTAITEAAAGPAARAVTEAAAGAGAGAGAGGGSTRSITVCTTPATGSPATGTGLDGVGDDLADRPDRAGCRRRLGRRGLLRRGRRRGRGAGAEGWRGRPAARRALPGGRPACACAAARACAAAAAAPAAGLAAGTAPRGPGSRAPSVRRQRDSCSPVRWPSPGAPPGPRTSWPRPRRPSPPPTAAVIASATSSPTGTSNVAPEARITLPSHERSTLAGYPRSHRCHLEPRPTPPDAVRSRHAAALHRPLGSARAPRADARADRHRGLRRRVAVRLPAGLRGPPRRGARAAGLGRAAAGGRASSRRPRCGTDAGHGDAASRRRRAFDAARADAEAKAANDPQSRDARSRAGARPAGRCARATRRGATALRARRPVADLARRQQDRIDVARDDARDDSRQALLAILAGGGLALGGALALVAALLAAVRRPLDDLVAASGRLAGGRARRARRRGRPRRAARARALVQRDGRRPRDRAASASRPSAGACDVTVRSLGDGLVIAGARTAPSRAVNPPAPRSCSARPRSLPPLDEALGVEVLVERDSRTLAVTAAAARGATAAFVWTLRDVSERARLERLKSEFVATASHELRSPLTSIKGFIELLALQRRTRRAPARVRPHRPAVDQPPRRPRQRPARRRAHRGRARRGPPPPVRPGRARRARSRRCMRPRIEEKRQTLEVDIADDLPRALADPLRVRQIVTNLVTNAHLYTRRGRTIAVRVSSAAGWGVTIEVADTGRGMTDEEVEHVFDRFFRGGDGTGAPGTGLGPGDRQVARRPASAARSTSPRCSARARRSRSRIPHAPRSDELRTGRPSRAGAASACSCSTTSRRSRG